MEIDLRKVLLLAKRAWWLLVLAPLVVGGLAFVLSEQQTPRYESTAMIRVNPPASEVLDLNVLRLTQDLTETYRRLIMTRPVLEDVVERLGLESSVGDLNDAAEAAAIAGTQLVRITVSDPDPDLAALIANTIATSFAERVNAETETGSEDATARTKVTVAEPAVAAEQPYTPRILFNTVLGAAAGLALAASFLILRYVLDNSVRGRLHAEELAGNPVLTGIPDAPRETGGAEAFALVIPSSPATEAIRLLRTNLEFLGAGKAISTLAVTSAEPGDGKSTVAANLAIVLAQSGKRTILVDADLRRPSQHRIFDVSSERGLSTLLSHDTEEWVAHAVPVAVPNLRLLPSGPVPPNPTDLLSLPSFGELLWEMAQQGDIVIVDTPPIQAVPDPLLIARQTGAAILVVRPGSTRADALRTAAEALRGAAVRVPGIVLNRQKSGESGSYYAAYYRGDAKRRRGWKGWRRRTAH